ncbi:MAG: DUF4270 domain-containing protein [Phocaeicola sp.]|nr:DUF4270 domain-containing protein [Phocaeicola sp.]
MKAKYICAALLALIFFSCDDSTPDIGRTTIAGNDSIPAGIASYEVTTRSILADSVFARSNTSYLGRYTDPEFGEFSSDFIAQFNCTDGFVFPDNTVGVSQLDLTINYETFFGDSTASMRVQVDTLDKVIPEGDRLTYYTSIKPEDYYNPTAEPIGSKAFAATGMSVDTIYTNGSVRIYEQKINLPLSLGEYLYNKFLENKDYFKDSEAFIQNVLRGVYVHCTHGDGAILYISGLSLDLQIDVALESSSGKKDSIATRYASFSATKEVIQSNRFSNSERLKELAEDNSCTYIKSPAGIITEVTLPIEEIYAAHQRDSLNAAVLSFTSYNETSDKKYPMNVPTSLLLLRKSETYSFFEQNSLYDNITSYYTAFDSKNNTYSFNNIAQLIQRCINEKVEGEKTDPNWVANHPDWNKVVLIPISVTREQQSNSGYSSMYAYYYGSSRQQEAQIIQVQNNLDLSSVRLVGGKNKLKMQILYTTF